MITEKDLCDPIHLQHLLSKYNIHLNHSLGQNFLTDASVPYMMAEAAELDDQTGVLEVGPGAGALTVCLLREAGGVTSLELDKKLFPLLNELFGDDERFHLIQGDVLKKDLKQICQETLPFPRVVAAANLPYYITTPAIQTLLDAHCFSEILIMVQKEVASRILAEVGTKDYGAFTLYVQYRADAELLFDVPAASFEPAPKVNSAVVRLTPHTQPPVSCKDPALLDRMIRICFTQRRKKLTNGLQTAFPSLSKEQLCTAISNVGLDPANLRGETMNLSQFAAIADEISSMLTV